MLDEEAKQAGTPRTSLKPKDQRGWAVTSGVLGWDVPEKQVGVVLLVDGEVAGVAGSDGVKGLVLDLGCSLDRFWALVGLNHRGQKQWLANLRETNVHMGIVSHSPCVVE